MRLFAVVVHTVVAFLRVFFFLGCFPAAWFLLVRPEQLWCCCIVSSTRELAGNGSVNFAGEEILLRFDVR